MSCLSIFDHIYQDDDYATLYGCMDVVAVLQQDKQIKTSAFHIRIGKLKSIDFENTIVQLKVNGQFVEEKMFIDKNGGGYFIQDKKYLQQLNSQIQAKDQEYSQDSQFFKSLRVPSENIQKWNLNLGKNKLEYIFESMLQGTQSLQCNIFFYPTHSKLIISDIDGTVTKSDIMGHIGTILGFDWTHPKIALLFNKLIERGYQIIYLTSRPITQQEYTSNYLKGINQDGLKMPEGPILTSPDLIISSFKREIIFKKPDIFKGSLLRSIQNLFPLGYGLIGGFGNRETDGTAYRYCGIEMKNIFIIDEKSKIQQMGNINQILSYEIICKYLDEYFPTFSNQFAYSTNIPISFHSFNPYQNK